MLGIKKNASFVDRTRLKGVLREPGFLSAGSNG